jgi:flagellar biosynthesis regulator FlbT
MSTISSRDIRNAFCILKLKSYLDKYSAINTNDLTYPQKEFFSLMKDIIEQGLYKAIFFIKILPHLDDNTCNAFYTILDDIIESLRTFYYKMSTCDIDELIQEQNISLFFQNLDRLFNKAKKDSLNSIIIESLRTFYDKMSICDIDELIQEQNISLFFQDLDSLFNKAKKDSLNSIINELKKNHPTP